MAGVDLFQQQGKKFDSLSVRGRIFIARSTLHYMHVGTCTILVMCMYVLCGQRYVYVSVCFVGFFLDSKGGKGRKGFHE